MSIATQLKFSYNSQILSLQNIYEKLKSERVEKIIESKEDGYTNVLILFSDQSKLKVTDINGTLYYTEI